MDDTYGMVRDFIICFTSILYEAMPFIVLGALIAGMLEELVPQQLIARIVELALERQQAPARA